VVPGWWNKLAGNVMKQTVKRKKRRVKLFSDLKQSLQDAVAYEHGKENALRVTELPSSLPSNRCAGPGNPPKDLA
jgi:hypothetical protein